jgi:hypothetical protein
MAEPIAGVTYGRMSGQAPLARPAIISRDDKDKIPAPFLMISRYNRLWLRSSAFQKGAMDCFSDDP